MYVPAQFMVSDSQALELIEKEPFATVIAYGAGEPVISHLPLVIAPGGATQLIGHMARANPQWQVFASHPEVLAIFHGPHTYITPTWYASPDVPTWNYAVVHVKGRVQLKESASELAAILAHTTEKFEGLGPGAWRYSLPDDLKGKGVLAKAIIGFAIDIESMTGKFKLSQNRDAVDRQNVMDGLARRNDDQSLGVRDLMGR